MVESYKALQGMIKLADAQHARLTLMFSPQYAVYIASDPARLAELEGWKKTGHEIGAYHEGPESRAWDGYSDLSGKELERARKEDGKGDRVPGHREYFEALNRLEPELKSGCMPDKADKEFLAAAPANEVCGRTGDKGVNQFLAISGGAEKPRKNLSAYHPADKAGIGTARVAFSSLSSGVFGASFKSSPSEFGIFYSWLAFLRGKDPQGLRSRTVAGIVDGKLLTEKEAKPAAEVRKAEKKSVQPQPGIQQQELPRLKPVPSNYGKVGTLMPERTLYRKNAEQRGYCGDGICDAFERAQPGRCPRDCGR